MEASEPKWEELAVEAGRVFTPNRPIDEKALFAGRTVQIRRVIDVVRGEGQHAILFGERGVGKTSLANVMAEFFSEVEQIVAPRVNCDGSDSFDSLWRKVFWAIGG